MLASRSLKELKTLRKRPSAGVSRHAFTSRRADPTPPGAA
jgi:hypothetical protein